MSDMIGKTVFWVVSSKTGASYGRPRATEAAAQKRADKLNAEAGIHTGPQYIVRPAQVVAVAPEGQPAPSDTRTDAIAATRAAYNLASRCTRDDDAAGKLGAADAHKLAKELWTDVAQESKDGFDLFLAEMHSEQEDLWLDDV